MAFFCTLESTDTQDLYRAFTLAFSDYSVQIDMPYESFLSLLNRNGYVPKFSAAAYEGETLAGFIINGVRMWEGARTAYDSGTGVIPAYRKQGLTTGMFKFLQDRLIKEGVMQYLLEVITTNIPAYNLYLKQGFSVIRNFGCYKTDRKEWAQMEPPDMEYFRGLPNIYDSLFPSFWDCRPSWQNCLDAARSLDGDCITAVAKAEGEPAGYGIMQEKTGSFLQLAVSRPHRGKGLGTALLAALSKKALSKKISFLNVDASCETMNAFLKNHGFSLEVEQYEMLKML